jgi:membrane associated rhomboid family serine protease
MEDLLLVLDEIDDAVAVLRARSSQFLGFFIACGLFAATIMAAIHWPLFAALLVFSAVIWATMPAVDGIKTPRFKTDP